MATCRGASATCTRCCYCACQLDAATRHSAPLIDISATGQDYSTRIYVCYDNEEDLCLNALIEVREDDDDEEVDVFLEVRYLLRWKVKAAYHQICNAFTEHFQA